MATKFSRGILALFVVAVFVSLSAGLALAQAQSKIKTTSIRGTLPVAGQELYTELCAVCHGTDGRGEGPAAGALTMMPTDLTQLAKQAGGKFPSLAVRRYIEGADTVTAHGTREMPIWGQAFRSLSVDNPTAQVELRVHNLTEFIGKMQAKP